MIEEAHGGPRKVAEKFAEDLGVEVGKRSDR